MSSRSALPGSLRWKWICIVAVSVVCLFSIIGLPTSLAELSANWERNIRRGLDLKGGTHMVLEIQLQDAFKTEADKAIDRLRQTLAAENIVVRSIQRSDPASVETAAAIQIEVSGISTARIDAFDAAAEGALGPEWAGQGASATDRVFTMRDAAAAALRQETMLQSLRTIDRRIDELGIAETSVQQRGGERDAEIIVQLPGVDDPERVNNILQTTALLELRQVLAGPFASREAASQAAGATTNTRVVASRYLDGGAAWWLLSGSPIVTGRDMRDARAEQSEIPGQWDTGFWLTRDAARRFEQFTLANIGERLAIVLDDMVLSAPRIDAGIGDRGRITGAANAQEAADLALNLRAGSVPAGIKVLQSGRVGPSLGADSIRMGVTAGAVALALVVASMVLYYKGAGINAVIALLLNTLITVAVLSAMGATWTLPGIAGLVLSIGMAVDSNVLIFERIKEELRSGKRAAAAVPAGFSRALVTIIDTHVTTVVASTFLFLFGTGPVRGFAVTLVVGLAANLFTAVFVSRAIFDLQFWRKPRAAGLSIGSGLDLFDRAQWDFMGRRKWTLGLSAAMVAICLAGIAGYGLKQGLDFRGGTLTEVRFEQNPGIDDLRQALGARLPGEFVLQETGIPGEFIVGTELAEEAEMERTRKIVEETLQESGTYEVRSSGLVGPRAGAEMRNRAFMATFGAFAGMLIYIAFRFQWISGVAAVIATVHDVVITLGLFAWMDREISLNIIAALLTLIGYSMNDKIVVFDRVRENQRERVAGRSFLQLVNQSINQTLSRTLLTAGPTLLACLALYFLGGEVLNGIAFALFVGIVAGTYSSVFVASTLLVMWQERRS